MFRKRLSLEVCFSIVTIVTGNGGLGRASWPASEGPAVGVVWRIPRRLHATLKVVLGGNYINLSLGLGNFLLEMSFRAVYGEESLRGGVVGW
jgi:hypothetical protein